MESGWRRTLREMGIPYGEWRKVRAAVLLRDGGVCQLKMGEGVCMCACVGVCVCVGQKHVHHTRGLRMTGLDMRWLVTTCRACNLKIGKPNGESYSLIREGSTEW